MDIITAPTDCGNARKGSRLAPAASRWKKAKKSLWYCHEGGGGDISRSEGLVKVDDCVSSFVMQTKHRCCVLILLMIIRVTQLSAAPLLTSLLLCNWSVTLRDTSATEFTPTDLSSLYSLLNGCAQWHYATQDPSWLLSKPFQIQFILLFLIWLMCKRYSTSIPLSLCSVVIHGAVLSFCGGVNGSGFSAPAEPIGTAEWNYSWASSSLQTNPWAAMSALLTSHAFCCVLLQHISLLNI